MGALSFHLLLVLLLWETAYAISINRSPEAELLLGLNATDSPFVNHKSPLQYMCMHI